MRKFNNITIADDYEIEDYCETVRPANLDFENESAENMVNFAVLGHFGEEIAQYDFENQKMYVTDDFYKRLDRITTDDKYEAGSDDVGESDILEFIAFCNVLDVELDLNDIISIVDGTY